MLVVKMEVAASRHESVDDMAAPAIAPMPTTKTAVGVRCSRTIGNTIAASPRPNGEGDPYEVRFQSGTKAETVGQVIKQERSFVIRPKHLPSLS